VPSVRILHLAKRYYTNRDALQERFGRVYRLPLHWSEAGHAVQLLLLDYHSLRSEAASPDGFPVRSLSLFDPRTVPRVHAAARRFAPDVVVASGDCMVGLLGQAVARRRGARFVFDVYDDYTTFGSHRIFLGRDVLGHLIHRADLVLYASRSLAARHAHATPWVLAPNGVDPAQFRPMPMAEARARTGLPCEAEIVGYLGSMEPDRGVDDLIAAVDRLRRERPALRLLLCGALPRERPALPAWVDYGGIVPHARVADFLNACDVVALPYRRSQMMDMGASCKTAEYLLCERPLVSTDTPNFTSNFPAQAAELGPALCRSSDPEDLARALAFQLERRRVVTPPGEFTWASIAAGVSQALAPRA
jgi:glycosyltransferase involved in cell wall biosynthesis